MSLLEQEVTDADLAALFDMSVRWVRDRAKDGTITRVGRNRYVLGEASPALAAFLGSSDADDAISRQRERKLRLEGDRLEIAKARDLKALGPVDRMVDLLTIAVTETRTAMHRVPARAYTALRNATDEASFKRILRDEIILAMNGLSKLNLRALLDASTEQEAEEPTDDE